jgi:hypothetical protein
MPVLVIVVPARTDLVMFSLHLSRRFLYFVRFMGSAMKADVRVVTVLITEPLVRGKVSLGRRDTEVLLYADPFGGWRGVASGTARSRWHWARLVATLPV